MKYCSKCGAELEDNALFCVTCGASQEENQEVKKEEEKEKNGLAICAIVFSLLISLVGVILGVVGLTKYKEKNNRTMCIVAIIVGVISMVLSALNQAGVISLF